ncbi:MAG: hypothetical protein QXR42_09025 [Candidatus Bathyarchaeia archaeon]
MANKQKFSTPEYYAPLIPISIYGTTKLPSENPKKLKILGD